MGIFDEPEYFGGGYTPAEFEGGSWLMSQAEIAAIRRERRRARRAERRAARQAERDKFALWRAAHLAQVFGIGGARSRTKRLVYKEKPAGLGAVDYMVIAVLGSSALAVAFSFTRR